IGTHRGYWFHTIGQRKGLGLSGGPWYVVKKNIRDNVIYVSNGYDTQKQYGNSIHMNQMHFISGKPWSDDANEIAVTFKNRHMPEFFNAILHRIDDDEYIIKSERKVQGIAPGQFGVIYSPDSKICYGSGIITGQSFT
ncbi:MAG: tRNA 2-thiouridine(34) synthase MnmA, partial [Muribaculaceae bacterium]|nr:tRNA 2-thiouridine(34) synthase MnmA [Muribaculaceae bacterium]